MGFYIHIEDASGREYEDDVWFNGKQHNRDRFWTLIQENWTDVIENRHSCEDKRRPASEEEVAKVRAVLESWTEEENRAQFLRGVDIVAKNPNLRFVPSY